MLTPDGPVQQPANHTLSFEDTEVAFRHTSNADLNRAYWLFTAINNNLLVKAGPPITNFAMRIGLPIKGLIKATIFKQFCGGETIEECNSTIQNLRQGGVGTILDYSVEGEEEESVFDFTRDEIMRTITRATGDPAIPITVFKITGVGRFGLLEKLNTGTLLTAEEEKEWQQVKYRVEAICKKAYTAGVPVMIDAEESWIQETIDQLAVEMMRKYNQYKVIVYNTYQIYRHDRLDLLRKDYQLAVNGGFMLGAKLVRGAYMEKERRRAGEQDYTSPIQPDKRATDDDYNQALRFCIDHIDHVALVAGTHNEQSCRMLTEVMAKKKIPCNHPHIYFSQLLGMSDNLSFNLADAGYNVAKYVPYGPVKAVLPYLFRRAQENTAIAGQMSRELGLIIKEKQRRKAAK
ncbi:proline dehydrogenase family protein [Mucilaginibacter sp.]